MEQTQQRRRRRTRNRRKQLTWKDIRFVGIACSTALVVGFFLNLDGYSSDPKLERARHFAKQSLDLPKQIASGQINPIEAAMAYDINDEDLNRWKHAMQARSR